MLSFELLLDKVVRAMAPGWSCATKPLRRTVRIARSLRRGSASWNPPRRRADPHLCFAHRVTRRNGHPDLDQPAAMEQLPAAENYLQENTH
ncbi:MAG: hypothetical protein ACLRMJ_09170 [Alistipes finegoldii]